MNTVGLHFAIDLSFTQIQGPKNAHCTQPDSMGASTTSRLLPASINSSPGSRVRRRWPASRQRKSLTIVFNNQKRFLSHALSDPSPRPCLPWLTLPGASTGRQLSSWYHCDRETFPPRSLILTFEICTVDVDWSSISIYQFSFAKRPYNPFRSTVPSLKWNLHLCLRLSYWKCLLTRKYSLLQDTN